MGHQESFLYCKDFDCLVDKVNVLGEEWFNDRFVDVVETVTLDNDLEFDLGYMGRPNEEKSFKEGTKFLWVSGDRGYQRRLYGEHGLFGDTVDDKEVELYFIECFSDKLFGENREWNFTYENFKYKQDVETK